MNKKIYDVIILGAGPVGLSAAGISGYYGMETLIIESSHDYGGQPSKLYANKMIHDFPTYQNITGQELTDKLYDCAKIHPNVEFIFNTTIHQYTKSDDGTICLIDHNNHQYWTKTVLLTIGKGCFEFTKPQLPNIENHPKIKYCLNHLYDIENIKNAIVLGGGDGAVDLAIHLAKLNINVNLIHRTDCLRAKGDPHQKLNDNQVTTHLNYALHDLSDNHLTIKHNLEDKITQLPYDLILVQYGITPLQMPIHSWNEFEVDNQKRYLVQQNFQTNIDGFYAAGSCIHYEGRHDLIITGVGEATIAINSIFSKLYPHKRSW